MQRKDMDACKPDFERIYTEDKIRAQFSDIRLLLEATQQARMASALDGGFEKYVSTTVLRFVGLPCRQDSPTTAT